MIMVKIPKAFSEINNALEMLEDSTNTNELSEKMKANSLADILEELHMPKEADNGKGTQYQREGNN